MNSKDSRSADAAARREEPYGAILELQQNILRMAVEDCESEEILAALCRMAEAILTDSVASVMVLDKEAGRMRVLSAPGIAEQGIAALNGLVPGPAGGACGYAVYTNQPVFIKDVLVDPRGEGVRDIFVDYNLCACWSMPVRDSAGNAIGSFALSSFETREPTDFHKRLLEVAAYIVSIILKGSKQAALISERESQLRLTNAAIDNASECFFLCDSGGLILDVNPAVKQVFGYERQELIGEDGSILFSDRCDDCVFETLSGQVRQARGRWQREMWARHKDGSELLLWVSASVIREGDDVCYMLVCTDLTDLKMNQRELERLAYFDQLTGLSNRQRLFDRVGHAIGLARRSDGKLALLFLDIDRFKNLNDTFGHLVGDEVLVLLAKRLQAVLREQDTLARLGGDEFVALIEDVESENRVYRIAEKLLSALKLPINYRGQDFLLNGSIGIALFPKNGVTAENLLKHADTAMYMAKRSGGSQICFYEPELTERTAKAFSIESDLRLALQREEFELYFQPKVSARSGEITGFEALIRWNHPQKGTISPLDFIPVAEETGLIISIGEWVLNKVISLQQRWRANNKKLQPISVNISGRQLNSHDIDRLVSSLSDEDVATDSIELELTETFLMSDPELSALQLKKLNNTGVKLAIDDFGSGYSSLGYLKRFKVDSLKIDRLLIRDIDSDPDDLAIVKAVIALAHSLDMNVVAEGVETKHQVDMLTEAGCDELQGFFFYKPMPASHWEEAVIGAAS